MKEQKKDVSINHQDGTRQEGAAMNTTPINHGDGQRNSNNNNQPMDNMLKDNKNQGSGRSEGEEDVWQEQRQP